MSAQNWRRAVAVAFVLLSLFSTSFSAPPGVLQADNTCSHGPNYIQVVAFTTIAEEEAKRNDSWDGITNKHEGSLHIQGYSFWAHEANRVGIKAGGITHCVNLTFVHIGSHPDDSETGFLRTTVREWAVNSDAHFFLAPFGSEMAEPVFEEMHVHNKVILSASASSVVLYRCLSVLGHNSHEECQGKLEGARRFETAFGVQPPDDTDMAPFLTLARIHKAQTLVVVSKNTTGSQSLGDGAARLGEMHGIHLLSHIRIGNSQPTQEEYDLVAEELKRLNPDVLVSGTDEITCVLLANALEKVRWYPKAALLTCCVSNPELSRKIPQIRYFMDMEDWNQFMAGHSYKDELYYPNDTVHEAPMQLYLAYKEWSGEEAPQTWIGNTFAVGIVIHETVMRMGGVTNNTSINSKAVIQNINTFSVFGHIGFDAYGQNNDRDVLIVQLDRDIVPVLVYPLNFLSEDVVYPIPTYEERIERLGYMDSDINIVFSSLAAFGIALSLIWLAILFIHREKKILVAASPLFLSITLIGSILLYCTIFAWGLEAHTVACHLRFWLLGVGFILTFGSLFAKTFRVMRIFGSKSLAVFKISNVQLALALGMLVLIEAILLAVYSGTSNPVAVKFVPDPDRPVFSELRCQNKNNTTPILVVLLVYNFFVAVAGIWLSIKTWNLKAKLYNESRPIAISMYSICCFGVLAVGLQLSNALSLRAMFAVRSVCILVATLTTMVSLFGPKAFAIHRSDGLFKTTSNPSATITTGTTNSKHTPSPKTKNDAVKHSSNSSGDGNASRMLTMKATDEDADYWKNKFTTLAAKYRKVRKDARKMEKDLDRFREQQY